MTKLDRIRQQEGRLILYSLRQKWGVPADLYKISVSVGLPNIQTGEKGVTRTKHSISSFLTCAVESIRKFEYDIGFLAANKNFTYGGFFEPGDRLACLDGSLVSEGLRIEQKDYFIINSKRFDIQRIESFDHEVGWMLHLRHTKDNKRYAILEQTVWNRVTPSQEIDNETV